MAKKVFIAPGHGGSDSGACANGLKEKDLNLTISLACRDELKRHGVEVKMSRETDVAETLSQQTNESNAFNPDASVNIHNNAGGGDGAEVFYSITGRGKELALNILDAIKEIGQNSRGVKTRKNDKGTDYYGYIRNTKNPAVIVECAFLDNKKDVQIVDTVEEQKAMGVAIAKGILKNLGIAYKEQGAQEEPEEETTGAKFSVSKWGIYKVNADVGLWLRNGASTDDHKVELMKYGAKVNCYGFYNGKWYMVASESGKVGFCHSDYLTKC